MGDSLEVLAERMRGMEMRMGSLEGAIREQMNAVQKCLLGNGEEGLKAMTLLNRASIKRLWTIVMVILTGLIGMAIGVFGGKL